jgi:hypothetical protein
MPNSQFTLFSYQDVGAPDLSGSLTGSLINILNYALVSGSGWTKPFGDTGSVGVFRMPTGSMMTLAIIDNAVGAGSTSEARIQGWETCASVLNGIPSGSLTAPYGAGCFPSGSQNGAALRYLDGGGFVVARKTSTLTALSRPWYVFADSSSMFFFALTGDVAATYLAFSFGDIYSFNGLTDTYRCLITGRNGENNNSATADKTDVLSVITTATAGNFMARSYTTAGVSITAGKHADYTRGAIASMAGNLQTANGPDGGIYISPVYVHENTTSTVRGIMRGLYHVVHTPTQLTDGQVFVGQGRWAGCTFTVFKTSGNTGTYLIETSNTIALN